MLVNQLENFETNEINLKFLLAFYCKIQRTWLDMNILLSEKQTIGEQGYFKPQTGTKLRRMMCEDGLYSENGEAV